jgi:anaerobic sulfite reductase subunit C
MKKAMTQVDYKALKKIGLMTQIQKDRFAMRLKVVGGQVSGPQLAKISEIAEKYGKGYVHLTSRQGIEIPFIALEDIEAVKAELLAGGLSLGTCGPRVRTITACQGSAICPTGLIDTTALAEDLDQRFGGREAPHKFKFGITGCRNNCLKAEENDLGFKGGLKPEWEKDKCTYCGLCEALCPSQSIQVNHNERSLAFDEQTCIYCGKCVKGCPVEAWTGQNGYILYFGGLFGNRIATAKQILPIVFEKEELFAIIEKTLAFFSKYGRSGERFRNTIERIGWDVLKKDLADKA